MRLIATATALLTLAGCGERAQLAARSDLVDQGPASGRNDDGSLFPADTAVIGNEELDRILSAQVRFPAGMKLAVLPLARRWSGDGSDGAFLARLREAMPSACGVAELKQIPGILLPRQLSVPALREVAARLQCEAILVYAVGARYDYEQNVFTKDRIRVRASLQTALIHVRSGIIPFSDSADEALELRETGEDRGAGGLIDRALREAHLRLVGRAGVAAAAAIGDRRAPEHAPPSL